MAHFTHKLVLTLGQLDSTPQTGGVSYFWGTPPYGVPPTAIIRRCFIVSLIDVDRMLLDTRTD
jgi:hypothetical protein